MFKNSKPSETVPAATWRIYHNPKCSKSRRTLEILRENGIEPEVIEYLKTPPTREELRSMIQSFEGAPHLLVRTQEDKYKELQFSLLSADEIAQNLALYPQLIERPVVWKSGLTVLGRPPENVLRYIGKP